MEIKLNHNILLFLNLHIWKKWEKISAELLDSLRRMSHSENKEEILIGLWAIYFYKIIIQFMIIRIKKWDL
jgi:hypothetical protein